MGKSDKKRKKKEKKKKDKKKKKHKRKRKEQSGSDSDASSTAGVEPLSSTQLAMARQALVNMLTAYPAIKGELIVMFSKIDRGETVYIHKIADEDIKDMLRKVFSRAAMTTVKKGKKEGYHSSAATPLLLDEFDDAFQHYYEPTKPLKRKDEDDKRRKEKAKTREKKRRSSLGSDDMRDVMESQLQQLSDRASMPPPPPKAPSSASSSSSSMPLPSPSPPSDFDEQVAAPKKVSLGPSVPTAEEREIAQRAAQQLEAQQQLDEYDQFGPRLPGQGSAVEQAALKALKVARETQALEKALEREMAGKNGPSKREEWMTALPDKARLGVDMSSRKFSMRGVQSAGDSSAWTDSPAERARKEERKKAEEQVALLAQLSRGGAARIKAQEEREKVATQPKVSKKRKKSMLEEFMEQKEKEEAAKKNKKKKQTFEWDYEKMMGARRELSDTSKQSLIKNAMKLGSRFSSGQQQNTFM